jgi:hypothetical protein
MSTLKTTYIQHPSATDPNIELEADGTVSLVVPSTSDTGAPWNIPYIDGGAPGSLAAADEAQALAIAAGLTAAGGLKQVKFVADTTNRSTTSTSFVDLPGSTVSITPTDAANRIVLIFTAMQTHNAVASAQYRFRRDTTDIFTAITQHTGTINHANQIAYSFVETAGNLTARDYKLRFLVAGSTVTVNSYTFTVMEVLP